MTHISRRKLKPTSQSFLSSTMFMLFKQLDQTELGHVFETILTKTEKEMLAKRIVIIMLLNHGIAPKKIAEFTHTTIQTVARMKLQLLEVPGKDRNYVLTRLSKFMLIKDIKKLVWDILNSLPTKRSVIRDLNKGW